ncbi:MAG: hypothetical protein ABIN80_02900, partial [Dyadobacter sp.]|uniref:hypothetical protein n=1 Tax=Dyadobacter sp. TaxID=1914288 RepID=UPI003263F315
FGLTPDSIVTDEYPENAQGQDTNIGSRVGLAYKGIMDLFREQFPGINKRNTGLFGSYGGDNFYGLIDQGFLFRHPKNIVAEYLSTKAHATWNIDSGTWHVGDCAFYTSQQHKDRNANVAYYMYFGVALYNIPLELVFANERIKIGSKTYQGEDHECDWMVFGTILSQSLMRDEAGQIGPEEVRSGDIIPLPNGEIMSRYNTPIAGNAGEHWDMGFWSCFIGKRGTMLWDGGGSYGQDPTKISTYTPAAQYIRWTPTGGSEESYVPGSNGAPENSVEGMKDTLYATVVDATMAGHQAALTLEGYDNILYYASYTSSRRTFVAAPGSAGLHLNGYGPLNMGMLAMKDTADQKCGTPIIGQGPLGRVAVYNNGFLSPDEYEDNVTLTYGAWSASLGRVYGGQTRYVKF